MTFKSLLSFEVGGGINEEAGASYLYVGHSFLSKRESGARGRGNETEQRGRWAREPAPVNMTHSW